MYGLTLRHGLSLKLSDEDVNEGGIDYNGLFMYRHSVITLAATHIRWWTETSRGITLSGVPRILPTLSQPPPTMLRPESRQASQQGFWLSSLC